MARRAARSRCETTFSAVDRRRTPGGARIRAAGAPVAQGEGAAQHQARRHRWGGDGADRRPRRPPAADRDAATSLDGDAERVAGARALARSAVPRRRRAREAAFSDAPPALAGDRVAGMASVKEAPRPRRRRTEPRAGGPPRIEAPSRARSASSPRRRRAPCAPSSTSTPPSMLPR